MTAQRRVLIIEDDLAVRRMTSMIFQHAGYQVHEAEDGPEGLEKVRQVKPDLIILDVMMPKMSGLEVCSQLRANPATARLPIIITSAKGQVSDRVVGLQAGADDYVIKPVDSRELLARAEAVLLRAGYAQPKKAFVIAIVSTKGGVGVTSLAVNIAGALISQGQSVVLIELRSHHGTVGSCLQLTPAQDLGELLAMEPQHVMSSEVTRRVIRHNTGIRVLPAPQKTIEQALTPSHVDAILEALLLDAQYLILDLPAVAGEGVRRALDRADQILLVTEPEPLSLASTRADLETFKTWGLLGRVGVVIVSRTRSAALLKRTDIESQLNVRIVGFVPPAPEAFQDAVRMGVPAVLAKTDMLVADAVKELVKWLVDQAQLAS